MISAVWLCDAVSDELAPARVHVPHTHPTPSPSWAKPNRELKVWRDPQLAFWFQCTPTMPPACALQRQWGGAQ